MAKKEYRRPDLRALGAVRNLTGGSGGNGSDAFTEKLVHDNRDMMKH